MSPPESLRHWAANAGLAATLESASHVVQEILPFYHLHREKPLVLLSEKFVQRDQVAVVDGGDGTEFLF